MKRRNLINLDSKPRYYIDLNNAWRKSSISNPNKNLYDGVYESNSNYNIHNGIATMMIYVQNTTYFDIYIRSYAESSCDYVVVSNIDAPSIPTSTSGSVKDHTSGNQQSGTALSNYKHVEFTNIPNDGQEHVIYVTYRKDGSVNTGDDRGYILIPYIN